MGGESNFKESLGFGAVAAIAAIAAIALASSACETAPTQVFCSANSDCAPGERCNTDGICVAASYTTYERPDAAVINTQPDASAQPDASGQDASRPVDLIDAGPQADTGSPDAYVPPPDAGPPDAGCPNPITIRSGGAYCTINAALAAAANADEIDVPAGTYQESIDINKVVALRGAGTAPGSQTVLRAAAASVRAVRIPSSNVTLEGFIVQADTKIGVEIELGSAVYLRDVQVLNAGGAGIRVTGSTADVTLENIVVDGVSRMGGEAFGVDLLDGVRATIRNAQVFNSDDYGIHAHAAELVTISASELRDNGASLCNNDPIDCGYGLLVDVGATAVVEGGTLIIDSGGAGIVIDDSTFTMRDSTSESNGGLLLDLFDGLLLYHTRNVILERNVFRNNTAYGYACDQPGPLSCTGNTRTGNGLGGSYRCGNCP